MRSGSWKAIHKPRSRAAGVPEHYDRSVHPQSGKVTAGMLALALGVGALAYVGLKYGPHHVEARRLRALVSEAGQRAASFESDREARAWFDARASEEGFGWLSSEHLYWQRVDRNTVHVGVGWTIAVTHPGLGQQPLHFQWYCTAREDRCDPFEPSWK